MSKPSKLPQWATGSFTTTEPTLLKKNAGYGAGEKPAPKVINWLFNNIYGWCAYVSGLHTEPEFLGQTYAWTAAHSFAVGILTNGVRSVFDVQLASGANLPYTNSGGVAAPRRRTVHVPLKVSLGDTSPAGEWEVGNDGKLYARGAAADGYLYLDLPRGSVLINVLVGLTDGASQPLVVELKRESVNFLGDGAVTQTPLGSITSGGTGVHQFLGTGEIAEVVNNELYRYRIKLAASAAGISVSGILAVVDDLGFFGNV